MVENISTEIMKTEIVKQKRSISFFKDKTKAQSIIIIATAVIISAIILVAFVAIISNQKAVTTPPNTAEPIVNTQPKPQTPEPATPSTNPPEDTTTKSMVIDSQIELQTIYTGTPKLITNLDLFVPSTKETPDQDSFLKYYSVGSIKTAPYNDYELIFAFYNNSIDTPVPHMAFETFAFAVARSSKEVVGFGENNFSIPEIKKEIVIDKNLSITKHFETPDFELAQSKVYVGSLVNITKETDLTKFQMIGNAQTYTYKVELEAFLTKTVTGFYKTQYINYLGKAKDDLSGALQITWTTPKTGINSDSYSEQVLGKCFGGVDYVTVDSADLVEAGTTSLGTRVYEYKDLSKDTYLKQLYDEDYIGLDGKSETYLHNITKDDDLKPFTYEEYIQRHPVFYWQNEFGKTMRFKNYNFGEPMGCGAKPAIYLYPTATTEISVSVKANGYLSLIYPKFNVDNASWKVTATADGLITLDNSKYDYLWWESIVNGQIAFEENRGFVLQKANLAGQLNSLLTEMNLNTKEKDQFLEYWLPAMEELRGDNVFVTFLFNEEVNQIASLTFNPKPLNEFRVFMLFKPVEKDYPVKPQQIQKANRDGFTVIEWGGGEI